MGLDYLTGVGPSKGYAGERIGFKGGSGKKILDLIKDRFLDYHLDKIYKELTSTY